MKNSMSSKIIKAAFAVIGLCGCSSLQDTNRINMESPSMLLKQRPSLSVTDAEYSWNIESEGAGVADTYARDYMKNGQGDFRLSVTYDRNRSGASENAKKEVLSVEKILGSYGINRLTARIIPVSANEAGKAVVSYNVITVKQPEDCAGLSIDNIDGHIDRVDSYRFGCATAEAMTGMVARKSDLAGNDVKDPVGSTQLGQTMKDYNAGLTQGEGQMNVSTGTDMTAN